VRLSLPAVLGLLLVAATPAAPDLSAKRSPDLAWALGQGPRSGKLVAWVFFTDKGEAAAARAAASRGLMTPRAASRRRARGQVAAATVEDLPVVPAYVDQVASAVDRVRQRSRWLNAVSVEATAAQLEALEALPFVARLDLVRRYRRRDDERPREPEASARSASAPRKATAAIDYGSSLGQLTQIGVPAVHAMGFHGEGVVVAVFDGGFDSLNHEVFSSLHLVAAHDFVNGDDDVGDGADQGDGSHGTMTLSVLGGLQEGQLVGPAFGADFILAKTENSASETPVEEDNWAAAAEWAESLGADVISSSLGYLDYDSPFPSYTFREMNGQTAVSTRAAEMAVARGVVVVNSAGNSGANAEHNTLGAPSDGAHVLAIAAVDPAGARASFSSVGPSADGRTKPDFAAQGQSVRVAFPGSVSRYTTANGTSFSCPLTAGVVALLLQVNPTASPEDVAGVLRATASKAGAPDNLLGWGIVNAQAAASAWVPAGASR
jgi:subtilisin family serine protease